ncbi:MAG: sialidase family protein [Promethearchaeota archaeon]
MMVKKIRSRKKFMFLIIMMLIVTSMSIWTVRGMSINPKKTFTSAEIDMRTSLTISNNSMSSVFIWDTVYTENSSLYFKVGIVPNDVLEARYQINFSIINTFTPHQDLQATGFIDALFLENGTIVLAIIAKNMTEVTHQYHVFIVYSSNGGRTWSLSTQVTFNLDMIQEVRLIEWADHSFGLVYTARWSNETSYGIYYKHSTDLKSWSPDYCLLPGNAQYISVTMKNSTTAMIGYYYFVPPDNSTLAFRLHVAELYQGASNWSNPHLVSSDVALAYSQYDMYSINNNDLFLNIGNKFYLIDANNKDVSLPYELKVMENASYINFHEIGKSSNFIVFYKTSASPVSYSYFSLPDWRMDNILASPIFLFTIVIIIVIGVQFAIFIFYKKKHSGQKGGQSNENNDGVVENKTSSLGDADKSNSGIKKSTGGTKKSTGGTKKSTGGTKKSTGGIKKGKK